MLPHPLAAPRLKENLTLRVASGVEWPQPTPKLLEMGLGSGEEARR